MSTRAKKRFCVSCRFLKTPKCRYARQSDLIDKSTLACEDYYPAQSKQADEDAKEIIIPKATVVGPNFLAEETWPLRTGDPVYTVYDFETKRSTTEEQIFTGQIDKKGRPKINVPLDNMSLREGLVIVPRQPKPCTFQELFETVDTFIFECYDPCGQTSQVKFLSRVAVGSNWLDRFVVDPEFKVAGMSMFAPILAIRGPAGSGKDRFANILGLLSRRPYSQMSTYRIPSLFRPLHDWGPAATLKMTEADMARTTEHSEFVHYFNCRAYGYPVSRQDPNDPRITHAFENFGMTIVSQRRQFDDNATESRCLPFYSEMTEKKLPTVETDDMVKRGLEIQDMILFLRMTTYRDVSIDKSAWIEGVTDARLNSSLLPLHAISLIEPSVNEAVSRTVQDIERLKVQQKATSDDGALVNLLWEKVEDGLFAVWNNPHYFFLARKEITEIDGKEIDISSPLTTRSVADELKWSAQHTRKVVSSLNLAPKDLPAVVKIGGKSYRPVFFLPEKLEKRLREFVVGYEPGSISKRVTEVTGVTLLTYSGSVSEIGIPPAQEYRNLRNLRNLSDRETTPVDDSIHEACCAWLREHVNGDGAFNVEFFRTFVKCELNQDFEKIVQHLKNTNVIYEPKTGEAQLVRR